MLQPVVRRTWAPRGQTPQQYSWDRHHRLSAIAALALFPEEEEVGLYFQLVAHNIKGEDKAAFMEQVQAEIGREIFWVFDRWSVHRRAARLLNERGCSSIEVVYLPAYAPELNPVERVWGHTKYGELANFLPDDLAHLEKEVRATLNRMRSDQDLLRSFLCWTGLDYSPFFSKCKHQ
jgi:transposase